MCAEACSSPARKQRFGFPSTMANHCSRSKLKSSAHLDARPFWIHGNDLIAGTHWPLVVDSRRHHSASQVNKDTRVAPCCSSSCTSLSVRQSTNHRHAAAARRAMGENPPEGPSSITISRSGPLPVTLEILVARTPRAQIFEQR